MSNFLHPTRNIIPQGAATSLLWATFYFQTAKQNTRTYMAPTVGNGGKPLMGKLFYSYQSHFGPNIKYNWVLKQSHKISDFKYISEKANVLFMFNLPLTRRI
jgi:hypothetical protein